jgi:integrase/recombinase XerD
VTILYLLYSTGMRLSEILSLRIYDLLWDREQIFIRSAKGKKDRYVMLAESVKALLSHYIEMYKPRLYLFEGQDGSTHYSSRSVQSVVKKASKQAGIRKHVTPHLLRHCFATHLVDGGTHIKYVQELLGHKNTNPDFKS